MFSRKILFRLITIATVVISTATLGIIYFEQVSLAEGLYRTLYIALAHHDAFHMEDWPGRIISILLIVASLLVIAYLLKFLAEYMISLGDGLKRNKVKAKLVNMKDHYVVCGLGRVGSHIARELANEGVRFVGIDRDEERVKEALAKGYIAFVGDSTKEEVLCKAKVDKAKGLVASLGDDSGNLFVTLTSRQLNPALYIVARANREENVARISRAGADKVAMPNQIGGFHMATMMIRPNVVDFLEVLTTNSSEELQVGEVVIPKASKAVGERLSHFMQVSATGATILALNNVDGKSQVNPGGKEILYPGDKLIIMGTSKQLDELNAAL